jgi:hypothetical protein
MAVETLVRGRLSLPEPPTTETHLGPGPSITTEHPLAIQTELFQDSAEVGICGECDVGGQESPDRAECGLECEQ